VLLDMRITVLLPGRSRSTASCSSEPDSSLSLDYCTASPRFPCSIEYISSGCGYSLVDIELFLSVFSACRFLRVADLKKLKWTDMFTIAESRYSTGMGKVCHCIVQIASPPLPIFVPFRELQRTGS
jgi:hypothetical protein